VTEGARLDRPQAAFLDHVYVVVDAGTAEEIERSEFLRTLGRFEVETVVADGETWTGRYLMGRRTYVELFGPDDVESSDEGGVVGIGLSTRDRGELAIIARRMKQAGVDAEIGRRTRDKDDAHLPWFDHLSRMGSPQALSLWVMEYLADPTDLERRESTYLKWTEQVQDDGGKRPGPLLGDLHAVELGTTADDIAMVEPLLNAVGFTVTRTRDTLLASDATTTITLHRTTRDDAGLQRLEFTLTSPIAEAQVEIIGSSRCIIGPGDRGTWEFSG